MSDDIKLDVRDRAIVDAMLDALIFGQLTIGPFEEDGSLSLSLKVGPTTYATGSESIETLAADITHLVALSKDPKIVTVTELERG
jgi:hypothetical protein